MDSESEITCGSPGSFLPGGEVMDLLFDFFDGSNDSVWSSNLILLGFIKMKTL